MRVNEFSTYFAAFTSYIGTFSVASHLGFTSPTQKELLEKNILSMYTLPIFASIGLLTRPIATLITSLLIQFNISINAIVVTHCLLGWAGWMLIISAESASFMIAGVALVGYYTGITVMFIMTYIPEVALDSQRRILSGTYGFVVRFGMFFTFLLGIWLSFRWLAVVGMLQIFLFCLFLQFVPTSPVQLVGLGLEERAKRTLVYLHGTNINADFELQKIKLTTMNKNVSWRENAKALAEWKVLKPLLLMIVLAFCKEFGGHQVMISFSSKILESQQAMDPKVAALFYPIFLIAGAIVCISILNYCRLKWLMIVASSLQTISHISMAIYFLTLEHQTNCTLHHSSICGAIFYWPICNVALFAFSFALGWGLVYFSLIGLMFSVHREISLAITEAFANISSYLIVQVFYYLFINIGGFGTFMLFGFIQLFSIVFVYFTIHI